MVAVNDIWGSVRVSKNRHQNKIANTLRGHKVPKPVRDKIWNLIHEYHVELSEKIASDLNRQQQRKEEHAASEKKRKRKKYLKSFNWGADGWPIDTLTPPSD